MRAKKSLGQNFLRDSQIIDRVIAALDLEKDDTVVEIGPGDGALTERLIETTAQIIAIEFDRDLVPTLIERFSSFGNFSLIHADALSVDLSEVLSGLSPDRTKLVANLPYNISTPILQRLIEYRDLFSSLVLMFQREVVERITAQPGNSGRGFLSVLAENAFETERLFDVPPTAFRPVPKVWSAVVRLSPKISAVKDEKLFRDLLSRAFAQKRKTIQNNLKGMIADAGSVLASAGVDPRRRAETLTLKEWVTLTSQIGERKRPDVI